MPDNRIDIIDQLSSSISDDVGNMHGDNIEQISDDFNKTLNDALKAFNSSTFDDDGFIKKMSSLELDKKQDKDVIKNVLGGIKGDYLNADTLNESELLLRRDLYNITTQMPEMRDVIFVIRDAIVESNVASGEVSRTTEFENHSDNESYDSKIKEIEKRHDLLLAIKNFIIPKTLTFGEYYVQVVPYAKLFAELEQINDKKYGNQKKLSSSTSQSTGFKESSLYTEENLKLMTESVSSYTKIESSIDNSIESGKPFNQYNFNSEGMKSLLENISVGSGSSIAMHEMGPDAFYEFLKEDYKDYCKSNVNKNRMTHFSEAIATSMSKVEDPVFGSINQDDVDFNNYKDIKGCYVKYLDSLRVVPIRVDRRIIGYYYISTTMDLQTNPAQPNGIVDLSYQHYTRDKNIVDRLANIIIKSFDKKMLEKNIKLKNEIAEIIMAHKFSEGKLSFIYIPENEIIRFVVNEDENGKGHGVLEPTMFPARLYLMLTMYNVLYTLNNNTTRVHYLKSSGLNKDYAAQIQRTMRKFQSRRITIDDIYSYAGVLNKVGGIGEMVLPTGRNDYKALETDTIEAVNNPINMEFLEQQRRQAVSGTGVPHVMMINNLDEAEFAKTLEMANARFISTVSAYKIDLNAPTTKLYQRLLKYETDLDDDIVNSFKFRFHPVKQQELNITADMASNFKSMVDLIIEFKYPKTEMEDKDGNPTPKQMHLREELAREFLPQLDFERLEEVFKKVETVATDDELSKRVKELDITDDDIKEISNKKK